MSLYEDLLAIPVGPTITRKTAPLVPTREVEVRGDEAVVTVPGDESVAADYLREKGLDPDEWEPTGFRSGNWTMANGETGESNRFTFRRKSSIPSRVGIDELLAIIDSHEPNTQWDGNEWVGDRSPHGFVVALGDTQFGKADGDGPEGTVKRALSAIDTAADRLDSYRDHYDIDHVHIAWLGDHIEGFVSQGGSNSWRTVLTLTEQIRLTRRVMLHALLRFAPLAPVLTMVAVPGNHGEAVRLNGKGVTRYDDSHDTEALISVADAAALSPDRFGHAKFYTPDSDELVVTTEVAGTVIAHAHGHQFRPGKHFEWWKGQAFGKHSPLHHADLLLAGHLHHFHVDTDGPRTFVQVPALESESTWWRHATGTTGNPGAVIAITKDGRTPVLEVIE